MKKTSKVSILMIAVLLVSVFLPFASNEAKADTFTNVTIHKVTGDHEVEGSWESLTGTPPQGLENSSPISNISFTYFKVSETLYNQLMANMGDYQNPEQVQELVGSPGIETGMTNRSGEVTVSSLEEGYYYFVENGSTAVATSNAVPFGLELPFTNQEGSGYIENLHVWPKNTLEDLPSVDKTVEDLEVKSNSYNIGEDFVWNIQTTVPKGIDEYRVYRITDELNEALDFDGNSVRVYYGDTVLEAGNDYTLSFENRVVTVDLTQAGLEKLGNLRSDATQLVTEITTVINENAVMGLPILNDATLDFDNNHGLSTVPGEDGTPPNEEPPTVEEPPVVYTGGKKFVKVNTEDASLQNAEFVIKNNDGLFLSQTGLDVSWVEREENATVFTSGADGTFEVKGLKYGEKDSNNQGSTDYILVETKAPEGYVLPTNPETTFTVNASSYYLQPENLVDADPKEIINKAVTIPNTGGIGTILFTVIGLLLMVSAFVMLKRKSNVAK